MDPLARAVLRVHTHSHHVGRARGRGAPQKPCQAVPETTVTLRASSIRCKLARRLPTLRIAASWPDPCISRIRAAKIHASGGSRHGTIHAGCRIRANRIGGRRPGDPAPTHPWGVRAFSRGEVEAELASRYFLLHHGGMASPEKIALRERRIAEIRALMDRGEWEGQRTLIELADKWTVDRSTVLSLVNAANTETEEIDGTPSAIRAMVIRRFTRIVQSGSGLEVIKAGEALAKLVGANAPAVDLVSYVRSLSLEDRRAFCLKIKKQAEEILASLPDTDSSERGPGT